MQINVTVEGLDAIDLSTVVGERRRYDHDTEEYVTTDLTLGDEVARRVTALLTKDDQWDGLRKKFLAIRDEEIREAVRPIVAAAITETLTKTNQYGQPTGETTTLTELIVADANKLLTERSDYGRGTTLAQRIVAESIGQAFKNELAKALAAEKEKVIAAVRAAGAELIAEAVKKGLGR